MSDLGAGYIEIGGDVSRENLTKLIQALQNDNPSIGLNFELEMSIENEADLLAVLDDDGTLTLSDAEAVGGMFMEIEKVLVDLKMDFDRHSDALYESDSEFSKCRNGVLYGYYANQNGDQILIPANALKEAFGENLERLMDTDKENIVNILRSLSGLNHPKIRPLKIID